MDMFNALKLRIIRAAERYGTPASTHESFGVISEEYAELMEAVHNNDRRAVQHEALDIAAAAMRLAMACEWPEDDAGRLFYHRSGFRE